VVLFVVFLYQRIHKSYMWYCMAIPPFLNGGFFLYTILTSMNSMNKKETRIRTVSVNERGQIVIPEEIRDDMGIKANSTLVLIENDGEITIKKEMDVISAIDEDSLWKKLSQESLLHMWEKEDAVWDKIARKDLA